MRNIMLTRNQKTDKYLTDLLFNDTLKKKGVMYV